MTVTTAGDSALLVRLGDGISPAVADAVTAALGAIDAARGRAPFVVDVVASYRSVLVVYDCSQAGEDEARRFVADALGGTPAAARPAPRTHEIPVLYHPAVAPDLESLAAEKSLAVDDLVGRHVAPTYRVHMLGFRPGFPFLGGLDPSLAAPRLPTPRTAVPAGSVGIGGRQTGIYSMRSPGGWRIVGRTPARIFDPARADPFSLAPGDLVRFVPIDETRYRALGGGS